MSIFTNEQYQAFISVEKHLKHLGKKYIENSEFSRYDLQDAYLTGEGTETNPFVLCIIAEYTHCSSCGTDTEYFDIPLSEIDCPDFLANMKASKDAKDLAKRQKEEQERIAAEARQLETRRQQFKELQKEFGK